MILGFVIPQLTDFSTADVPLVTGLFPFFPVMHSAALRNCMHTLWRIGEFFQECEIPGL